MQAPSQNKMGTALPNHKPLKGKKTVLEMGYADVELDIHGIIRMNKMDS